MAEFASDDTGVYSIVSFYKYAVAKYNLYIYWFLKLLFYCFAVSMWTFLLLLYRVCVLGAVPLLFRRAIFF